MKKIVLMSACVLALSTGGAFAQSSQGKAGSDNGPTSNSPTTNSSGSAGTHGTSGGTMMRNDGTTGAGAGSSAPSSQGNVGPGTNNNSGKQPGGR